MVSDSTRFRRAVPLPQVPEGKSCGPLADSSRLTASSPSWPSHKSCGSMRLWNIKSTCLEEQGAAPKAMLSRPCRLRQWEDEASPLLGVGAAVPLVSVLFLAKIQGCAYSKGDKVRLDVNQPSGLLRKRRVPKQEMIARHGFGFPAVRGFEVNNLNAKYPPKGLLVTGF